MAAAKINFFIFLMFKVVMVLRLLMVKDYKMNYNVL